MRPISKKAQSFLVFESYTVKSFVFTKSVLNVERKQKHSLSFVFKSYTVKSFVLTKSVLNVKQKHYYSRRI